MFIKCFKYKFYIEPETLKYILVLRELLVYLKSQKKRKEQQSLE